MAWYNPASWGSNSSDVEKANPAQHIIAKAEGSSVYTDAEVAYALAFERLESVNRGVSMIVNAVNSIDIDIKNSREGAIIKGVRKKTLEHLLNVQPNPYQSQAEFRQQIFTDFLLEGNIFIYWDGAHMYHLPAAKVEVVPHEKTFVAGYKYNGQQDFGPDEIIHVKDLSAVSIYRGTSRLVSARRSIKTLYKMQEFQDGFFDNGAIAGLVLTTENTLSIAAKEKSIRYWQTNYSSKNGAKKPLILDSGLKPHALSQATFQDMDFDTSIKTHDIKILKALGVPAILLDGGNNANISPNLRLFYLETVLPISLKFISALERFFGYDLSPITATVSALQPELKELAGYYTTLTNGGIITPNEAREELRYTKVTNSPEADELRIPANIAGSAANPADGGRPTQPKKPQE